MADGDFYPGVAKPSRRPKTLGERGLPRTAAQSFPVDMPAEENEAAADAAGGLCADCPRRKGRRPGRPRLKSDAAARAAFALNMCLCLLAYSALLA